MFCTKCGYKNNNDVKFCINCGNMLQVSGQPQGQSQSQAISQAQGQSQSQATSQPQGQLQSQAASQPQGQSQSQVTNQPQNQMQSELLNISPLQGIYMQRKEPIANELPKSSAMSILIGGIFGLFFGVLASDQGIGTVILTVMFGIFVGFSIWFERGVAKLKNLDIKRFYLPRESDNNEIFELMLRLCSHDSMKVEQMKNGIVRVIRDEIRYDIYIDNKRKYFRIDPFWVNKKYFLTPYRLLYLQHKKYYIQEIEVMGYIAYYIQHGLMGEL